LVSGTDIPLKIKNKKENLSLNLSPGQYWLLVARLEPENNIHIIVDAFSKTRSKYPLIIVGDFTDDNYEKEIFSLSRNHQNVHFLGSIYDIELLDMLRQNCFGYLHGHTVGGTNPSLLEAMSMGNIIVAHGNQFNKEVCGNCAIYFEDSENLKDKIKLIESNPENYQKLKLEAFYRVKEGYLWKKIVEDYETLFERD
ncbi:MAG: glycosyltransferase, partial [Methanobacterium sp.]